MDVERRRLLAGLGATALLTACGEPIIFQREPQRTPENLNRVPERGDVIFDPSRSAEYLLRSYTAMRTSENYWKNSKGAEYGRRKYKDLPDYVREDIFDRFQREERVEVLNIVDPFSGQLKRKMPDGGEMTMYFGGALTSRGFPLDGAIKLDRDPFVEIRRKLMESNWQLFNSIFFTYSTALLSQYKREDTLKPVPENITAAIRFLNILADLFPFVQFNIVAHSLGGIFALEAAKRHMDIINNLILIDVPFGGLDTSAGEVKEVLGKMKISLEDNPVTYLDGIKKDKNRQRDLDGFGGEFTGKKRKLTIIRSEGDPITKDSKDIKGANLVVLKGGGHGAALDDKSVNDVISETIGPNLAAAA